MDDSNKQSKFADGLLSPKITVVIPTAGRPEVERAVRSVLEQTIPASDIVVVNDGHESDLLDDVQGLDGRIRIVQTQRQSGDGGATARNLGVKAAQGDWIAFLDDDDEWLSNKLEIHGMQLVEVDQSDRYLFATGIEWRGDPGGLAYWPTRPPKLGERVADYLFIRQHEGEGWLPTTGLFVARDVALRVPFREGLKQHVDYDWILRLEDAGIIPYVTTSTAAVMHVPPNRKSVSQRATWEASLIWAIEMKEYLGPAAFSAFCLTEISRRARRTRSPSVFLRLLRVAAEGDLGLRQVAQYVASWVLPEYLQQKVRRRRRHLASTHRFVG